MGASSSKSSSKPQDVTPQAFKDLQTPFAQSLQQFLSSFNSSSGASDIVNGYQGPLTTAPTANETSTLDQLQNMTTNGSGTPANAASSEANSLLTNTVNSGQDANSIKNFVNQLGIGQGTGSQGQSLSDFINGVNGASQTGAFSGDANNPLMQAYIQAAQRQTQQALEETLGRTLPGRFAAAGQSTQPGGSSAFDRAAAIATRGSADALGDIATNISYKSLSDAQNREADLFGNELSRRGTADENTKALTSQAQQAQADRALQASKQQTDNAVANSGIKTQEVDNTIKNLQAQALPRMIQDLGIERGIEVYNSKINSLLAGLGIASGTSRPVIANDSKSSSGSIQLK